MKGKQTKHFVPKKSTLGRWGYPACHCYHDRDGLLVALSDETSLCRKGTTCKNCRKTKIFRKVN